MLVELLIENFAIIDRLTLTLSAGLTVITGETGAGKSIIIDALQIALGARASADSIRDASRPAAVEAIFELPQPVPEPLADLLSELDAEPAATLILRREIHASGRSTARVNGRAVPMATIASVGALLVDIHGQSDHLSILRRDQQLDTLDRFGGLIDLRAETGRAVRRYLSLQHELAALQSGRRDAEQRLDLLRFQVQEIESAELRPGEDDELATERARLANAEKLIALADRAYEELRGDAGAAADRTADALAAVHDLQRVDDSVSALVERLEAVRYEVEDLAQEVRGYRDTVEADPARLQTVEERLDLLNRLARKYGPDLTDVIEFGLRARRDMEAVENVDQRLEELDAQVAAARDRAAESAVALSNGREAAAARLNQEMAEALLGLGLKGTDFGVRLGKQDDAAGVLFPDGSRYAVGLTGVDTIEFLVSFNAGEPLRPIEKVASGGETSRFLLALKSVLAGADQIPTLVFDEVDVGVGARNGAVVGERLAALAEEHQVVSITHLPQIAAMADHHLLVSKQTVGDRTGVEVASVSGSERVREIAEMMTGAGSDAAIRNAEELLASARSR